MSQEVRLEINRLHYPVNVLGPGRRIGMWLQGCSIGCAGCVSQDTWEKIPSRQTSVSSLLSWCREQAADGIDGITISGGEPFDQAPGLLELLVALHRWRTEARLDFDILCYSGHPWKRLQNLYPDILEKLDAIVPEPFNQHAMPGLKWRGSSNQTLRPLTPRGQRVYSAHVNAPSAPEMQVNASDGTIWLIGIPPPGGLAKIEEACRHKGLHLKEVSWHP